MIKKYQNKDYLIQELKDKCYIQIAKENNVSPDTIQHYMNKYGLTKKRISWTEEELNLLKENYSTKADIYKSFPNRTISSINHKANKLGLSKIIKKRPYNVNHDFFKGKSPEVAYILGFFFSDGSVLSNKKEISLHLHKQDFSILEHISEIMKNKRPIKTYGNSSYLKINSKILANDLIASGCVPKKSLILEFPVIDKKILPHFVRGYFDGDGSIHFNRPNTIKVSFVGSKNFLDTLRSKLSEELDIKKAKMSKVKTIWRTYYYGDDARKLCYWIYKNSKGLYLKRKKNRFDNHLRLRNEKI